MKWPYLFVRILFVLLTTLVVGAYTLGTGEATPLRLAVGLASGLGFGLLLIAIDLLFKNFSLRSFNIGILGLFLGYLMGQALVLILDTTLVISRATIEPTGEELIKIALFLFGVYLGIIMTLRASYELSFSIPFITFTPTTQSRELLLDSSILADGRLMDLAACGLLDKRLLLPRFLVKDLTTQAEYLDELTRSQARRRLDAIKKLEAYPTLDLRYTNTDFPEMGDSYSKLLRLARLLKADILTAEMGKGHSSGCEEVRFINVHALSYALKPSMQTGETLQVVIQSAGEKPRQGVGYLDDGSMVVVNGAEEHIGQEICCRVLSVKNTVSGRMVFCNTLEKELIKS